VQSTLQLKILQKHFSLNVQEMKTNWTKLTSLNQIPQIEPNGADDDNSVMANLIQWSFFCYLVFTLEGVTGQIMQLVLRWLSWIWWENWTLNLKVEFDLNELEFCSQLKWKKKEKMLTDKEDREKHTNIYSYRPTDT
jgi:hypothetical protein